jgi:two-component system, cell cycle sensor histidine kinase and response regulator CckA
MNNDLPRGNGEHILIVDDESQIADMCKVVLNRCGYEAETAYNISDAKAKYNSNLKVLISDVLMKGENGGDLAVMLNKELGYTRDVIFMSGTPIELGEAISHVKKETQNNVHYMLKPFPLKDLAYKVNDILNPTPTPIS